MKEHRDHKIWKPFIINISLIIAVFIISIFIGIYIINLRLIENELKNRARVQYYGIVLTRRWNAQYGGVYVEKKRGVTSNPYLRNPDIVALDGKVYTLKNPALMTREISQFAKESDFFTFSIPSLKPINPINKADAFEKKALLSFEKGKKELFGKLKSGNKTYYRYIAPLFTEKSCLSCHAEQGYKVGSVRGAISVSFDITETEETQNTNAIIILGLAITILIALLGFIYMFILNLIKQLKIAHKKIEEMADTDPLTELYNRRFFFDKFNYEYKRAQRFNHHLSCLLIDIDFFKNVNDTYGHQIGDTVLKGLADYLKKVSRSIDIYARYGGEEFIVLLPETDLKGATAVGEKIRIQVSKEKFPIDEHSGLSINVSIGVTTLKPDLDNEEGMIDKLIKKADELLYLAKKNGRNRVESEELSI